MEGRKAGRPVSRPVVLRDGFYIIVRNKVSDPSAGIKIRKDTKEEMLEAVRQYSKSKIVVVLGEYKNGKPVLPKKEKTKK